MGALSRHTIGRRQHFFKVAFCHLYMLTGSIIDDMLLAAAATPHATYAMHDSATILLWPRRYFDEPHCSTLVVAKEGHTRLRRRNISQTQFSVKNIYHLGRDKPSCFIRPRHSP